ncbi:hypothetical protein cyc_00647 [Cyclospora cayetanensis]|uniref:Uncharacterized protein n=1 Tax=Cyclospora cayetanensis TaxID=88456 RepID=A0A1D3CTJ9_9EIME|nr:hypothetical protein cyc_00647 [Cyclospora cayetanensis]
MSSLQHKPWESPRAVSLVQCTPAAEQSRVRLRRSGVYSKLDVQQRLKSCDNTAEEPRQEACTAPDSGAQLPAAEAVLSEEAKAVSAELLRAARHWQEEHREWQRRYSQWLVEQSHWEGLRAAESDLRRVPTTNHVVTGAVFGAMKRGLFASGRAAAFICTKAVCKTKVALLPAAKRLGRRLASFVAWQDPLEESADKNLSPRKHHDVPPTTSHTARGSILRERPKALPEAEEGREAETQDTGEETLRALDASIDWIVDGKRQKSISSRGSSQATCCESSCSAEEFLQGVKEAARCGGSSKKEAVPIETTEGSGHQKGGALLCRGRYRRRAIRATCPYAQISFLIGPHALKVACRVVWACTNKAFYEYKLQDTSWVAYRYLWDSITVSLDGEDQCLFKKRSGNQ